MYKNYSHGESQLKRWLIIFLLLIIPVFLPALTLNTNLLTNASFIHDDGIIVTPVTELPVWKPVLEPRIPNSYLSTGEIELEAPETALRRFDITFFVSVPITYYLFWNLFIVHNSLLRNALPSFPSYNPVDDKVQKRTLLLNTLLVPLFVAYKDYRYMQERTIEDEYNPYSVDEASFSINLFQLEF